MRLFLALELPDAVRQRLTKLSKTLQEHWESGRQLPGMSWVRPENLHVTLKFFGEVADSNLPELCGALERVTVAAMFRLVPDRMVCLPPRGPIRVVGVGLAGELEHLQQLHRQIEQQCAPIGFPAELRAFRPHVTLARVKGSASSYTRQTLEKLASAHLPAPSFDVSEFVLMQSHLDPRSARYVPVARFPLDLAGS